MSLVVSAGTADDLPLLEPLWIAMVEHHRSLIGDTHPVREGGASWMRRLVMYRDWMEEEPGTALFLAHLEPGAAPVGYALVRLIESAPTVDFGPLRGEVESLSVLTEGRGQGVGTALLGACRAHCIAAGCAWWGLAVVAANAEAKRLYASQGFQPYVDILIGRLTPPDADA